MNEQVPSNQWNTPWRASGFAVYDTSGNLVAHTGITGNRSMHGKQLELMAAMIAEAVNAYSAGEPPADPIGFVARAKSDGTIFRDFARYGEQWPLSDGCEWMPVYSRPAPPPPTGYAGDSIAKLLADMRTAAEAARTNPRDAVSAFVMQWIERIESLTQPPSDDDRVKRMEAALRKIARWHNEFPSTERTWDDGSPMSYAACFGSNGERDYMRQVALDALKESPTATKEGGQ